ncbi:MAG TPA: TIGR03668 family PPOX class F420-dependent oxidoreductase [Candidatus Limnocylindrales bacterium]|nr:TIGR03668 family PPOX class F420-dependent oxidoreductase [Candidatus Limnocylindrales bacterium]
MRRARGRLEPLERLEPLKLSSHASRLLNYARTAHLATTDNSGQPHVIPICFVFDRKYFYSPIDEKPKRAAPSKLKRLTNIRENPKVALVVDHYEENWRKLAYVLVFGTARILQSGAKHRSAVKLLRRKYRHYRSMAIHQRPMIAITAKRIVRWGDLESAGLPD